MDEINKIARECNCDGDAVADFCTRSKLSVQTLKKMRVLFRKLDKDHSGTVEREELFAWLEEPYNFFSNHIFELVEARKVGSLDLLEFVKALTTFVLFGTQEILQFCFFAFDSDKNGFIDHTELHQMVTYLHGNPEERYFNVNYVLQRFDKDRDGVIDFGEFQAIHKAHPFLLYPLFRLQKQIERKTFGSKWWDAKRKELCTERQRAREIEQARLEGIKLVAFESKNQKGSLTKIFETARQSKALLHSTLSPLYLAWLETIKATPSALRTLQRTLSSTSVQDEPQDGNAFDSFEEEERRRIDHVRQTSTKLNQTFVPYQPTGALAVPASRAARRHLRKK